MSRPSKESGAAWLGSVPEEWAVVPAKSLFAQRADASRPDDVHLTPSQKYGVLPQTEYMAITDGRVVLNLAGSDNMKHVEPGDVISHLRSFQGGLETSDVSGKVSTAYTVLRPRAGADRGFFRYLFKSERYIQALGATTNQLRDGQSIRYAEFSLIPLPLPPLTEQRAIADYLDRETAKIDTLIEKQTTMIERLRERRAALYSHVFSVSSSDGWKTAPLRWAAKSVIDCPHWTPEVADGSGFEAVRSGCIRDGAYRPEAALQVSQETFERRSRGQTIEPGDVLFAREAPAGEACLAPPGRMLCLGQRTVLVKPNRARLLPELILANIYSRRVQDRFAVTANGSTVTNIRLPVLRSTPVVVPPLDEQREIADYLDRETAKIDTLIAKVERHIELAKERRAALITAAVTGQIDVTT